VTTGSLIDVLVSASHRIALAAETGARRGHIVTPNLTFAVRTGTREGHA